MIACVVEYTIDPDKLPDLERFAREWIRLVDEHGGQHHAYFLPAEGASDRALALFSFPPPPWPTTSATARSSASARVRRSRPDPRHLPLRPAVRAQLHAPAPWV